MNVASLSRRALMLSPLIFAVALGCNKQKGAESPEAEPDTTQEVKEAGKAAGEEVEEAAEDTGEAVEDTADKAGDKVQDEP